MKNLIRAALLSLLLHPTETLAQDFDNGWAAYEAGNYVAALKEWRPLAEQGDAFAQSNLGIMYENGQGVPKHQHPAWLSYPTLMYFFNKRMGALPDRTRADFVPSPISQIGFSLRRSKLT